MEKVLDSIPLTHEAMLDIDGLTAEVMMFIMNNMRLKTDSQMWEGDNAAPNWAGIYAAYATDFTQAIATGAGVDCSAGFEPLPEAGGCSPYLASSLSISSLNCWYWIGPTISLPSIKKVGVA